MQKMAEVRKCVLIAMAFMLLIALIGFTQGCASVRLTPEQTALYSVSVYNDEYNRYIADFVHPDYTVEQVKTLQGDPSKLILEMMNPDLTQEQRESLQLRKKILVELHPLVNITKKKMQTGTLPDKDVQELMKRLLTELLEGV